MFIRMIRNAITGAVQSAVSQQMEEVKRSVSTALVRHEEQVVAKTEEVKRQAVVSFMGDDRLLMMLEKVSELAIDAVRDPLHDKVYYEPIPGIPFIRSTEDLRAFLLEFMGDCLSSGIWVRRRFYLTNHDLIALTESREWTSIQEGLYRAHRARPLLTYSQDKLLYEGRNWRKCQLHAAV